VFGQDLSCLARSITGDRTRELHAKRRNRSSNRVENIIRGTPRRLSLSLSLSLLLVGNALQINNRANANVIMQTAHTEPSSRRGHNEKLMTRG